MKKLQSIFAIFLAFALIFQTTAFAANDDSTRVNGVEVTEANGVRTGSIVSGMLEYTVVYDTNNHTVSFTERNLHSGNTCCSTLEISDTKVPAPSTRVTIDQDTRSGFRCKIDNMK